MKTNIDLTVKTTIEIDGKIVKETSQVVPVEVEVVVDQDKPIIIDPPKPEPIVSFDDMVEKSSGVWVLPEEWYNKEVIIESKGMLKPSIEAIIGNNTILTFKDWESTPTQLFDLSGKTSFGIAGVTFVCPPNRPLKTAFPDKELFGWSRDSVLEGTFAYIDGQEIFDKDRVTFGLSRFAYSSDSNKDIYLIAKNIYHNGFNFSQIKNPHKGNLWLILENVKIHNPIVELPRSHYYSPTRFKCRISIADGVVRILSDNTFSQILTHWGYSENNVRSILHFDRYAFDILSKNIVDDKTCKIEFGELHPNDNLGGYGKVITKQIKVGGGFEYTFETNNLPTSINLPEGEFDAFICYKGTELFSVPITKDTYFSETDYWGSGVVTISNGYGWSWYNEEFSGYIDNFHGTGYFRNSGGSEQTKGLTIKNSTFQKNPPISTANLSEMPKLAKEYIFWLEGLKSKLS